MISKLSKQFNEGTIFISDHQKTLHIFPFIKLNLANLETLGNYIFLYSILSHGDNPTEEILLKIISKLI